MDSFGARRRQLFEILPTALRAGGSARNGRSSGQGLLFGGEEDASAEVEDIGHALPDIPEWSDKERLGFEKALLGIYLSSHPLAEHQGLLRIFRTREIGQLASLPGGTEVIVGGMVTDLRVMTPQKARASGDQRYARFMFEDASGRVSCIMFADTYAEYAEKLTSDLMCFLQADVDTSREEVGLIVREIISLETAPNRLSGSLLVRVDAAKLGTGCVPSLKAILTSRPGKSTVYLDIRTAAGLRVKMQAGEEFLVSCDRELVHQVESLVGEGNCNIIPNPAAKKLKRRPEPAYMKKRESSASDN